MSLRRTVTLLIVLIYFMAHSEEWKAVPANQALYHGIGPGMRRQAWWAPQIPIMLQPRSYLHSTYKFGWCSPDSIRPVFLRSTYNISLKFYKHTLTEFLYFLQPWGTGTQRFALQCIVMKTYVPKPYFLRKSRLPLYYCQGQLTLMVMNTIEKIELHEFYFYKKINMPASFVFEFYQPTPQ